jgi:hypothetical protein
MTTVQASALAATLVTSSLHCKRCQPHLSGFYSPSGFPAPKVEHSGIAPWAYAKPVPPDASSVQFDGHLLKLDQRAVMQTART